ncbi:hypothetical protein LSH36_756g01028 [Paralvinella palmiformis]|uniref:SUEL-type lectin domain-containing protein n=1 Tax=Paralvinella palmiformis TaxID=53620 RepID=A0AAD9MUM2_9ANNE|nr:hypothetical protein LSH36_756g01028 [Paralvinella palmiformis]
MEQGNPDAVFWSGNPKCRTSPTRGSSVCEPGLANPRMEPVWAMIRIQEPRDYCQSSIFNATCPPSHVILMTSAFYGRMKTGSCVSGSYGQIGCKEDVLDYMDRKCSGMRKCSVYIADSELHARNRCPRDLAVYLEAAYICIKAVTSTQTECSSKGSVLTTDQQGYLTSHEAIEKNLGTLICPWVIRMMPGQKIAITYYNFGGGKVGGRSAGSRAGPGSGNSAPGSAVMPAFSLHSQSTCYEVGTISERKSRQKTLTTCGGDNGAREGLVYTSTGHEVMVTFLRREVLRTLAPFVIKYEAKGCPTNVVPPPGSYVTYDRAVATIKCNHTDEVWYLTCTKNKWIGARGNCSKKNEVTSPTRLPSNSTHVFRPEKPAALSHVAL